jgi:Flp pilus assembly protein TadB
MRASLSHAESTRRKRKAGYVLPRGDGLLSKASDSRRRRTGFWFAFYTAVLLAIAVASILTGQWSVALTTLAIAFIAGYLMFRFLRRR